MFQRFHDRAVDAATGRSNDVNASWLTVNAYDDFSGGESRCDVLTMGEVRLNTFDDCRNEQSTADEACMRALV